MVGGMKKTQDKNHTSRVRQEDELAALGSPRKRFFSCNTCFGQQVYTSRYGCLVCLFASTGEKYLLSYPCGLMGFNATRSPNSGAKGCSFDDDAGEVKTKWVLHIDTPLAHGSRQHKVGFSM